MNRNISDRARLIKLRRRRLLSAAPLGYPHTDHSPDQTRRAASWRIGSSALFGIQPAFGFIRNISRRNASSSGPSPQVTYQLDRAAITSTLQCMPTPQPPLNAPPTNRANESRIASSLSAGSTV